MTHSQHPLVLDFVLALAILACGACDRLSAPGSSSGGGSTDGPPITGGGAEHPAFGLVSVVPESGGLRIDWRAVNVGAAPPALAVYVGPDSDALFAAPPVAIDPPGESLRVSGLVDGVETFVGLGVDDGTGTFERIGPVLRAVPRAPIYADPAASAAGADGLTPGTAFASLFPAVLTAFAAGGGNVWVAEGVFTDVSLPLFEGVHIYGGFAPGFVLDERDPALHPTSLHGRPGEAIVSLQSGVVTNVLDGFALEGLGQSNNGVDLDDAPAELRGVSVRGCDRGAKLRAPVTGDPVDVVVVHSSFVGNSIEGLSVDGAFDLVIEDCLFRGNGQEGLTMDDWIAPDGQLATLRIRDSRFEQNGAEGLDVDLAAPLLGFTGGAFKVRIEDCEFLSNGQSGLLLDVDFEQAPLWTAEIEIRGSLARANGEHGVVLDLDASSSVLVHRLVASANRLDGLRVDSETVPGTVVVSSSALACNLGAGLRSAGGNFGVVLAHSVLAGNFGGGSIAELVPTVAVSSVAHLQPAPWQGTIVHHSVEVTDPAVGTFANAAAEFLRVIGASGGDLALGAMPSFGVGTPCETAGDDVTREAVQVGAASVRLDPAPEGLSIPTALGAFAIGGSAVEDYRLAIASPAEGAGMAPPFGAPVDAGPFGAPMGGAPGFEDLVPADMFRVSGTTPAWVGTVAPMQPIVVAFQDGVPAGASVAGAVFVVDGSGTPVASTAFVAGGVLVVEPPAGGWSGTLRLELHAGLAAEDGALLAVPIALPILTQ